MEKRQWEAFAEENRERQAIPTKVEVELWHDGVPDLFYAKLRKIGSYHDEKTGMNAETWEALTKKDMPQRFTVMLAKGTTESHIQLCKFRETDFGARMIQKLGYIALILIYIPLLSALGGLIPSEMNFLDWYWIAPISTVIGIFFTVAWYNNAAVCGRLVVECAYPTLERGGHHVCYICHSKTSNVLQQLNAWDRHSGKIPDLINGLVEGINARTMDNEDYIARLEWEADQRDKETQHQVVRHYNRAFRLGGSVSTKVGISPATMVAAIALVSLAVGLIVYYWK